MLTCDDTLIYCEIIQPLLGYLKLHKMHECACLCICLMEAGMLLIYQYAGWSGSPACSSTFNVQTKCTAICTTQISHALSSIYRFTNICKTCKWRLCIKVTSLISHPEPSDEHFISIKLPLFGILAFACRTFCMFKTNSLKKVSVILVYLICYHLNLLRPVCRRLNIW